MCENSQKTRLLSECNFFAEKSIPIGLKSYNFSLCSNPTQRLHQKPDLGQNGDLICMY